MQWWEVVGGISVAASNEQSELINRIKTAKSIDAGSLNERDSEIARQLVSKGILKRKKSDGKTIICLNDLENVWRNR